jgi:hypothetical protein
MSPDKFKIVDMASSCANRLNWTPGKASGNVVAN